MKNTKRHSYFTSAVLVCLIAFTSCKVTSQEPAKKK